MFGAPLTPADGESTRRFNARIEAAVAALADEATTDYWTARQRAAAGTSPSLAGPEHTGWRRQWDLSKHRRAGIAGWRRPPSAAGPISAELDCRRLGAALIGRASTDVRQPGRTAAAVPSRVSRRRWSW